MKPITLFLSILLVLNVMIAACADASPTSQSDQEAAAGEQISEQAPEAAQAQVEPTKPSAPPTPVSPASDSVPPGQRVIIIHVTEGDTLRVRFNTGQPEIVRLFDLDTPETVNLVECFGVEASKFTKSFDGQAVWIESEGRDEYERLLAYIWIEDGRLLNEELVKLGYAHYNDYGNPGKYATRVREAAKQAQESGIGLWSQCQAIPIATSTVPVQQRPPSGGSGSSRHTFSMC